MDRQHLARLRLRTTLLTVSDPAPSATGVVDHLVAVQAQEFALSRWSVGQRSGVDDVTVAGLLDAGQLLRTHVLRPTWHFVRPADLRWLQELTAPRVQMAMRSWMRIIGLDEQTRSRFCAVAVDALAGGRSLTRDQMAEVAADAGIVADRMTLSHLLMHAELESVVCSGPVAVPAGGQAGGRHHTYALVDDRVPSTSSPAPPRSRRDALAELTVRYFCGHGPATVKDFAWWSSLTITDIRRALSEAGDVLEQVDVEGRAYWGPPGWSDLAAPAVAAHLLQTFDEFVVGYGHSRDALDVGGIATMVGPRWGRDGHPVVLDGQVVAHWRLQPPAGRADPVSITPRRDLTGPERLLVADAAVALERFIGVPARWALAANASDPAPARLGIPTNAKGDQRQGGGDGQNLAEGLGQQGPEGGVHAPGLIGVQLPGRRQQQHTDQPEDDAAADGSGAAEVLDQIVDPRWHRPEEPHELELHALDDRGDPTPTTIRPISPVWPEPRRAETAVNVSTR